MPITAPDIILEPFGVSADVSDITVPIPVDSQIPIDPARASFETGFPPINFQDQTAGGIPPDGRDFNGIMFMITAYCAWIQGGGQFQFSQDFSDANGGYGRNIILQSAINPSTFFFNTSAGNTNDPDVTPTGWISYSPISAPTGIQAATLTAGAQAIALASGVGFLDCDTSAGAATITDLTAAKDGQILIITHVSGAAALTIQANTHFRMAADLTLLLGSGISLRFSSTLNKWVAMS